METLLEIGYEYFRNKNLFKRHKYASPKASNIEYIQTLSPRYGLGSVIFLKTFAYLGELLRSQPQYEVPGGSQIKLELTEMINIGLVRLYPRKLPKASFGPAK